MGSSGEQWPKTSKSYKHGELIYLDANILSKTYEQPDTTNGTTYVSSVSSNCSAICGEYGNFFPR